MTSVLSLQPSASLSFAPSQQRYPKPNQSVAQTVLPLAWFKGKNFMKPWFLPHIIDVIGPVNCPSGICCFIDIGVPSFDAPHRWSSPCAEASHASFWVSFPSQKKSAAWLLGCLADYDERFLWKPKNHIIELGFRNIDGDLQKTRLTRVYASMSMHPGSRHALLCNLAWTMSRAQGVPVEASLTTAARIC